MVCVCDSARCLLDVDMQTRTMVLDANWTTNWCADVLQLHILRDVQWRRCSISRNSTLLHTQVVRVEERREIRRRW